jgi:hypothetical protein
MGADRGAFELNLTPKERQMTRKAASASQPVFHAPMLIDWSEEKLRTLSQEQLLNLLENLDRQRSIGRLPEAAAAAMDGRIAALLTGQNGAKRRKQAARAAAAAGQG